MMRSTSSKIAVSLATGAQLAAGATLSTIYQFASNDTWLENIAVRSNGLILATEIGPPANLLAFNASTPGAEPTVLANFPEVLGLSGITEAAHDVFYVTGANTTSANIRDPPTNATHVWRVEFEDGADLPTVSLVCRPQAPTGFNGLAAFNESIILATASYQSSIFAVNVETGYTWEAIVKDDMTQINGLKVQDGYVYYTAGAGNLIRAPLYENITAGTPEVVYSTGLTFDDFAISPNGFQLQGANASDTKWAYLSTAGQNSVEQVGFNGATGGDAEGSVIVGSVDSTDVAEPTGAAFGRIAGQLNKVYITTGGGSGEAVDVDGVETAVGAQLLEVTLDAVSSKRKC